ncbi:unnamed protein product [Owenia fusiformis]|uniref:HMG box domain-containing protein n=1 Tax=Owenia fusiformis TaxID=6347 RepID=A0A8S4PC27_OWEFU|nr:unnamed protein product [Owenia fusiformis]
MTLKECLLCRVLSEEEDLNIVSAKDVQRMQKITGRDIQMTGDDDELVVCVSCRIHIDSMKFSNESRSTITIDSGANASSEFTRLKPHNLPDPRSVVPTESSLYEQTLQKIIDEVRAVLGETVPNSECGLWISDKKHSLVKQLSDQNASQSDLSRVAGILAQEWKNTHSQMLCILKMPCTSSIDNKSDPNLSLLKFTQIGKSGQVTENQIQPNTVECYTQELTKVKDPKLRQGKITNQPDRREDNHIKRPLNAFMLWSKEFRTVFKEKNPNLNNTQISQLLGEGWRKMSNEEKDVYYLRSSSLMRQHSLAHPGYKYQPRIKKPRVYNLGPDDILQSSSRQKNFSPYVSKYQTYPLSDGNLRNHTKTSTTVADAPLDANLQVFSVETINQEDFDKMDSESSRQCSNDESDDSDIYIEEIIDSDDSDDIIDITKDEESNTSAYEISIQKKHETHSKSSTPQTIIIGDRYVRASQTPLHYIPIQITPDTQSSIIDTNSNAHTSSSHSGDVNHNLVRHRGGNKNEKGEHIKRPLNAFMVFNKELRNSEFKGTSLHTREVSAILSKRWKDMSDELKSSYYDKAAELGKEHMRKYPNYTYMPRMARPKGTHKLRKFPQFRDLYKL